MCGLFVCARDMVVTAGPGPKRDAHGKKLCEVCEHRLNRIKGMKYKCKPGLMCHKCYDKEHPFSRRVTTTKRPTSTVAPPTPKRVRRIQSDPGKPVNLTRKRTRAQPPTISTATKRTHVHTPVVDASLLLNQAHAQRLALIADEKRGQPSVAEKKSAAHSVVCWSLIVCE